jgi:hypothetical protein
MKSDTLRPDLKEKINEWLISFHHLDPRNKILTFFNQVASTGADNMVDEDESDEHDLMRGNPIVKLTSTQELLADAFNATSILTVWRPCSNDAMRKMMEGTGVGKGLDIKGKSAQKGKLSAFVPFMQIHENKDTRYVQKIPLKANLRVYYSSAEAREEVITALNPLVDEANDIEDKQIPGKIVMLDKYNANGWYGMELSQRLFWLGYVVNQDISRGPDTQTGRPSTPGFQDANLKTLKVACGSVHPPSPMPVLIQYNPDLAMSPQYLVMGYEENGTVTPVVSDFDGFLLGWRREALWFGCNLPREQEDLMMWCINHIEDILDARPSCDTWTVRWLEILKKEASNGFIPQIPEYGFGDPKSYSIMEQAALRLIDTGAVRHGSECFNYYFPQEIDDVFLLISDTIKPVPWKYVSVTELQEILSEKIAEGFVFPLNPKWILCDPGWKKVYDELLASDALYADLSKDVWYPPWSGMREKIEAIYKKHPQGFQQRQGRTSFEEAKGYSPLRRNLERGDCLSGNAAFDLAELELENFTSRKGTLARQIREATMDELPECDEEDEEEVNKEKDSIVSKRSLFRKQREEAVGFTPVEDSPSVSRRTMFHESFSQMNDFPRRNFSEIYTDSEED